MQPPKHKDQRFRISLTCAIILALFALVIGVTVLWTLRLSHPTTVLGPGFYPLLLSILMFVSCLYIIYSLLYGDIDSVVIKSAIDTAAIKKPLTVFILVVSCVAAMPLLGFVGSMFLFSFVYMTGMEKERQPLFWGIFYSAAIAGGAFLLFRALQIHLPVPFWL